MVTCSSWGNLNGIVLTTLSEHNGAEQSLEDKETCCLSSIFLPNVESKEEFLDIVELSYKMNKHSLMLASHHKDTEKIVHKNMRMGINITGVLQASGEQYSWLSEGYEYIRDFDKKYSEVNKLRPSIKLTTVQPSGCNAGNTLIPTDEGLFYLSELGDTKGEKWQDLDTCIFQESDIAAATRFYVNGLSDTLKIMTSSGIEIECTPEHKYRVLTRAGEYIWKEAKNLSLGDILPYDVDTCTNDNYVKLSLLMGNPCILDEDLAYLLGSYEINSQVGMFGIYAKELLKTTEAAAYYWLNENKLLDQKELLYKIRRSPASVIKSFLKGLDLHKNRITNDRQFAQEIVVLSRYVGLDASVNNVDSETFYVEDIAGNVLSTEAIDNTLKNLEYSHLRLDEVVDITPSKALTYDIEVPENNCYIANSYVSHNTLSLLPGVTSGVHPAYAQYLYRRIRIASNHPLVELCRKSGYPTEYAKNFDGTEEYNTVVVTFPFKYPEGTRLAKDMTAIDQLNEVRKLQTVWSDNAVSCTVYYKKEELPEIKEYLEKYYKDNHKSLSFLLHSEHGFQQAPLEEITKEQYEELISKVTPITYLNMQLDLDEDSPECSSGVCPVR